MKLIKAHIENFQSVNDSNEFDVGDVTCLVGKNEAGKTALLKALYRLKPVRPVNLEEIRFDAEDDYPRQELGSYEELLEDENSALAEVTHATYELSAEDVKAVTEVFGPRCIADDHPKIELHIGYENEIRYSGLNFNNDKALKFLVTSADLSPTLSSRLLRQADAQAMIEALQNSDEESGAIDNLAAILTDITGRDVLNYVCKSILFERIPYFLYFDEYYQLKGQDNLDAFIERVENGEPEPADFPLLGLIELAKLDLDQMANPERTRTHKSRLENAGNRLTRTVLTFWSQNRHLQMEFDVREGLPGDPAGMTEGLNIWGYIRDIKHNVSTPLGTRSRGFLWFFSFLAWYSNLKRGGQNLILLLDEPGLSLHAKAQGDLLNFFEKELVPHHQLIYTTHSPFMVDPKHFDRIRIVQDLSIEKDPEELTEEQIGTRVSTKIHEATSDSLFPLQGALGYGITQSLFIGPNCLVVEGLSDLKYLQELSVHLQRNGRQGLQEEWTITPVGGSANVPTFVALLGAQDDLNVAVLIDYQKGDQQRTESLFKEKLLKRSKVLTFADFVAADEADIEDMFDPDFYLKLVNGEFGTAITVDNLPLAGPRIVWRLEKYFQCTPLTDGAAFNHTRPARYLSDNIGSLEKEIGEDTLDRFERMFTHLNELL